MSDLAQKNGESFIDYASRLIDGKENGIYDIDKAEIYEMLLSERVSSDHARKMLTLIKKIIAKIGSENIENSNIDDVILEKIRKERIELEKEKIKVRTEKISLSQLMREQSRFELFVEQAVDTIKNCNKNFGIVSGITPNVSSKSGALIFTDVHFGKELKVTGLNGETLNEYNEDIFISRMNKILNQTIHICNKEGFNSVSVFDLGDDIEGMLRMGQLMSLKYGLVESSIRYAYFLASWLEEMSKYLYVDFYFTEGNHSDIRLLNGKKGTFPHENMGKVILTIIREVLRDNKNIFIHINNTNDIFTQIQGFNILGVHGEESSLMDAIKSYSNIYNTQIDYMFSGHKHHSNTITTGIKKACIGVGSVLGIDEYSMKLKKTADASATFLIFEEGQGKTEEKTIYLS